MRDVIAIIEDDATQLSLMTRLLEGAGFDVRQFSSAETALPVLTEEHSTIDLVVSDIGLPNIDGLELLRRLRVGRLDLPVVLVTGAPDLQSAITAVEHGAFRYLTKPVDPSVLVDVVRNGTRLRRFARLQRDAVVLRQQASAEGEQERVLQSRFEDALIGIWIAYQPIVEFSKRRIVAYEALVRTSSAVLCSPTEMFDAAERLGRLFDLGRVIRRRAAADIASLTPETTAFVNLHPRDLLDEDLFSPGSPLSQVAHRVVLEMTERASLEGIDDLKGRLARLAALGFRIALDDLGAGYSGLVSFTLIEPQVVKLDMALTRDIEGSPTKQKLVRSMLGLCEELGMMAIAEGIESENERAMLSDLGCSYFQGYLFAKPSRPFCSARFE